MISKKSVTTLINIKKEVINMKKNFSIVTMVLALMLGLVLANTSMAKSQDVDFRHNGITWLSTDSAIFDAGPVSVIEENLSGAAGSHAGGLTAAAAGRYNGTTYFSTGPATFDAGPMGRDAGGSYVKSRAIDNNNFDIPPR